MRGKWSGWVPGLLVVVFAATAGNLHVKAEVSADPSPTGVRVMILGIIEGPDPIPQIIWEPVRDVDPELFLNPEGAPRGDGRPAVAMDPVTGWPHVVWAWNNGTDHDIAYSQWTGSGWDNTQLLTSSLSNEIDPRIYVDEGTSYVVWWDDASSKVWLVSRPRDGYWGIPEPVSQSFQTGKRPSVVSWGGSILVAAEDDDGQGGKEILVSIRQALGGYTTAVVGSVPQAGDLDVVLHSEQGKLWMDWRHSGVEFAYSVFDDGAWGTAVTVPWTDDSWIRREEVRLLIRDQVIAP